MKRLQKIISAIVFLALLFGAILKCADVLESKEARKKYIPFYESETNFDVIFLGTSHVKDQVLPMEMWDEYGIASYNWGHSNCTPAENYYLIQDILKYTSPKIVVIDVYGITEYDDNNNGKYKTGKIEQQHVQFDSLPISLSKIKASQDVFDDYDNNEDFIWNFIMYHNRWSELGEEDFKYEITTQKGATFLTGLGTGRFQRISEDEKREIDSVCYPYFLNLIEYCEEQGVQVLCVYLPYGAVGEGSQLIANSIGDIVEAYPNCHYVNMLTKNIVNLNTDVYQDNSHLNYSGSLKVTKWLGEYLVQNYELDDYSDNDSWYLDYQAYYEYKVKTLEQQTALVNYLVQLADSDFSAELEFFDENLFLSDRLMQLCNNAEISPIINEKESDYCAHLVIKSQVTGEIVSEVDFICDDITNLDIFSINKASE